MEFRLRETELPAISSLVDSEMPSTTAPVEFIFEYWFHNFTTLALLRLGILYL